MKPRLFSSSIVAVLTALVLLCTGSATLRQESIKIYEGIVFNSREISGSDIFAEPNDKYMTSIPGQLEAVPLDLLFTRVGSYRKDANTMEPLPLFDMSNNDGHYPLLDKIDFDYYQDISFAKLRKEKIFNQVYKTTFDKFMNGFQKAPSLEAKKDTLNRYPLIKSYLVTSRLLVRQDTIKFSRARKTQLTANLKAELSGLRLPNGAELSPGVKAYLSSLVDQNFKVSGFYYTIRLHERYVSKILYHVQNIRQQDLPADEFSHNLIDYVKLDNSAINSQVVAFEFIGFYDNSKVTATQLSAELTARYAIPQQQAVALAASISGSIDRKTDRSLRVAFNHVYFIRYGTGHYLDELAFKP